MRLFPGLNSPVRAGRECFVNSEGEPLYQRGWTLQERLLSRRLLIYGRDQVAWECQSGRKTESNRSISVSYPMHFPTGVSSEIGKQWRVLVEDYTKRRISIESDKLPAIAGVAQAVQTRSGDQYLAGLWKENLLNDLLWAYGDPAADLGAIMRGNVRGVRKLPSRYRAPSWSWAAVDGGVRYDIAPRWPWRDRKSDPARKQWEETREHAKILGAAVTPSDPDNDLGEVSGGYIDLRGPLMNASCLAYQNEFLAMYESSYVRAGHCHRKTADGEDSEKPVRFGVKIFLDGPDGLETANVQAAPLELAGFWFLRIRGRVLLVLRPSESEGGVDTDPSTFKRVGLAVHRPGPWYPQERELWFSKFQERSVRVV